MKLLKFISLFLGMTLYSYGLITSETENASRELGADYVHEVKFNAGKTLLDKDERTGLANFIQNAKKDHKIKEIKVLAWSDKEYPPVTEKLTSADIRLAKRRAKEIERYLQDNLTISYVTTYNMAERPNGLEKLLHTSDASVKTTMENQGASPRTSDETGFFGLKSQASKAVIMLYLDK